MRAEQAWSLDRGAVIVPSGLPVPIAGTDLAHDFHVHAEHVYLAGLDEPGQVLAFDPGEGWTLFVHEAGPNERIWVGETPSREARAERSGIEQVLPASELAAWLEARRGEPMAVLGNRDLLDRPEGYEIEGWHALEPVVDEERSARLAERVSELRRRKDADELDLMRRAAEASVRGHLVGMRLARPGMTERELQIEIEAEFFRAGGARTAYGSIVGTGSNGAVLHFAPTDRAIRDGDLILVDAGAEVGGYASDVTRTYPATGQYEGLQRDLYELVYATQQTAIAAAAPGIEYRDLHLAAALQITTGLVDVGILRGDPTGLVERDAHAQFFPHGLGHMLGLATHDAGGCLAGREPSERFGLNNLRADLPLEPGYVVTIEPGIYFVRALLEDRERREQYRDAINWERVDGLIDFGGIRIEDDVLITEGGAEVLSGALPSDAAAIEAIRREALEA